MPIDLIAERLIQPGRLGAFLADLLAPDEWKVLREVRDVEVNFEIESGKVDALPWEWLVPLDGFAWRTRASSTRVQREVAAWIQRALRREGEKVVADGVYGPTTVDAMNRFAKREGEPPSEFPTREILGKLRAQVVDLKSEAQFMLVQPREGMAFAEDVSFASRGGFDAQSIYREFVGDVHVVEAPTLKELEQAVKKVRPHVIHLIAAVNEQRGLAYLDYSRERGVGKEGITASALRRVLSGLEVPPFIVLDVARPSSTWDAGSALIRRNQIAGELLHARVCTGVLATGLAQPADLREVERQIVRLFGINASLRELAQRIREFGGQSFSNMDYRLAFGATALFTMEPELPCVAL